MFFWENKWAMENQNDFHGPHENFSITLPLNMAEDLIRSFSKNEENYFITIGHNKFKIYSCYIPKSDYSEYIDFYLK